MARSSVAAWDEVIPGLSDIDLLASYAIDGEAARVVMQRHAELIDWWPHPAESNL